MSSLIIKELIIDEDDESQGVQAVSLVDYPAIEENFIYFNENVKSNFANETKAGVPIRDFYQYTAQPAPEVIDTSHDFCRRKAGHVYHISEIQSWGNLGTNQQKEFGFIEESKFFRNFRGNTGSFNINQQIYNCRHWLRRVNSEDEIPTYKRKMKFSKQEHNLSVEFKIADKEKREIEGLVLQSGQFIYRNDINGLGEGYVFFSRDTIRKLMERYGFNRTITIQHQHDITGTAILLDSWLMENEDDNKTEWYLKYKIIDDKLWESIKIGLVKGFSIESIFDVK